MKYTPLSSLLPSWLDSNLVLYLQLPVCIFTLTFIVNLSEHLVLAVSLE